MHRQSTKAKAHFKDYSMVEDAKVPYPKCYPELHIERVLANLGTGGQLQSIASPLETALTAKQHYLRNFIRNQLELYYSLQPS